MDRTGRLSNVRMMASLVVILAGLIVLVGPAASARAAAINPAFGYQPQGTVTSPMAVILRGTVKLVGYPLDPANAKMYVDGVSIPRSSFQATASRNRPYFYYAPKPVIADGAHTFRVEMPDTSGRVYAFQWTATVAVPPTGSWLRPAANYVGYTGYPAIEMSLSDNTPGTEFTVDGAVRAGSATGEVVATFAGSGLSAGKNSFSLAGELAPGTYFLTATVADGGGFVRSISGTAARKFTLIAAPAMTRAPEDCLASGCHVRTGHPATGMTCAKCHVKVYHYSASCDGCHDPHKGPITVTGKTGPCTTCHDPAYPAVKQHTSAKTEPDHVAGCGRCHGESFMDRHALTPAGSAYPNQCDLCHASADARVQAAVATQDSTCSACHDSADYHIGYLVPLHQSEESCVAVCHSAELGPEHAAVAPTVDCESCHAVLGSGAGIWDATCTACHAVIGHATASHAGSDAWVREYTNNFPVKTGWSTTSYPMGCSSMPANRGQGMCHDISDISVLHQDAPDNGCAICHAPERSTGELGNECITCHSTGWYTPGYSLGTIQRPGSIRSWTGTSTIEAVGVGSEEPYTAVTTNDGATSYLRFYAANAEALFGRGAWWINPATTTITNVQVQFRARKLTAGTTASRMTALLDVGGSTYVSAAAATNPSTVATYNLYTHTFTTNPKTGVAWTLEDLVDPDSVNGLRAFGVRQTANALANIGVTEVVLKVNTPQTLYPNYPVSGGTAHHYGNYLRSPQTPDGEWSSAIYMQYCYDRCHVAPNPYNYYGDVLSNPSYSPFGAYEGEWMWASLMGDPGNNSPKVRNHTLLPVELPAGSPRLEFMTNYVLGTGGTGDWGYVEISVDDGGTWVTLEGEEAGVPVSSFSGTAGSWKQAVYDLSGYAGQTVQLRWRYVNDIGGAAGWGIDNVVISEGGTVIFSDDAESERLEWDSGSHWRRIKRALRWLG